MSTYKTTNINKQNRGEKTEHMFCDDWLYVLLSAAYMVYGKYMNTI